jgi:hypothetical protein
MEAHMSDNLTELERATNHFLSDKYDTVAARLARTMLSRAEEGDRRVDEVSRLAEKLGLEVNRQDLYIADDVRQIVWRPIAQTLVLAVLRHICELAASSPCLTVEAVLRDRDTILAGGRLARRAGLEPQLAGEALSVVIDELVEPGRWPEPKVTLLVDDRPFTFCRTADGLAVARDAPVEP